MDISFSIAKDEVSSVMKLFHRMIKTQFDANIKVLRSDNGGLFSRDPQLYLQENIIESQTSCPYTPKQNRSC